MRVQVSWRWRECRTMISKTLKKWFYCNRIRIRYVAKMMPSWQTSKYHLWTWLNIFNWTSTEGFQLVWQKAQLLVLFTKMISCLNVDILLKIRVRKWEITFFVPIHGIKSWKSIGRVYNQFSDDNQINWDELSESKQSNWFSKTRIIGLVRTIFWMPLKFSTTSNV